MTHRMHEAEGAEWIAGVEWVATVLDWREERGGRREKGGETSGREAGRVDGGLRWTLACQWIRRNSNKTATSNKSQQRKVTVDPHVMAPRKG